MIDVTDKKACCGCAACASACPAGCISVVDDSDGFRYPSVDYDVCIECGRCNSVCPFLALPGEAPVTAAFAARTHDEELLHASSSGGIFTELCKPVIETGGAVYGVSMDTDCRGCSFIRADDMDGIAPMRGSKYLQADSRGVFERVRKDLRDGRIVLFAGTPCQANALSLYLGGRRENLLLVDCICHGVPSPRLWAERVADLETRAGSRVESVNFRCKEASLKRMAPGRDEVFESLDGSLFLRMFLGNVCLRESCYACKAKATRLADITLADFWGIESVLPEMSDSLGCSLVIVRTDAGMRYMEGIGASLAIRKVEHARAIGYNSSEHASAVRPPERDIFFADLDELGYSGVAKKYGMPTTRQRFKGLVIKTASQVGLLDGINALRGKPRVEKLRYGILYVFEDEDTI